MLSNHAMIVYLTGLDDPTRSQANSFPFADELAGSIAGSRAASLIAKASSLAPDSPTIAATEARIALTIGDAVRAAGAFDRVTDATSRNPLINEVFIASLTFSGQPEKALMRYRADRQPIEHTRNLSDTLALADLQLAQPLIEADMLADAVPYLMEAVAFRPIDLYANWHLLLWSERVGNASLAVASRQRLEQFTLDAVAPIQSRLLPTASQAVVTLSDSGLWDHELTLRVARFLVWQTPEAESVRQLVASLAAQRPDDPQWKALLGELSLRRGDPTGAPHRDLVTSDLADLAPDLDPHAEVAHLLAVRPNDVELGLNLLPQGDFDQIANHTLEGWRVADYATGGRAESPAAAFGAGPDAFGAFDGAFSARIDGLWKGADSLPGFFGLVTHDESQYGSYALSIAPQRPYAVTGIYRTGGARERVSIYLGHPVAGLFDAWLPPTDGGWRPFVFVGCHNQPAVQQMQLLLRLWREGQVWFDDVRVQEIAPTARTVQLSACR